MTSQQLNCCKKIVEWCTNKCVYTIITTKLAIQKSKIGQKVIVIEKTVTLFEDSDQKYMKMSQKAFKKQMCSYVV